MVNTVDHLSFVLSEAIAAIGTKHPALSAHLTKAYEDLACASHLLRTLSHLRRLNMSSLNITDLVTRTEAVITKLQNDNAKLQGQIDASAPNVMSTDEVAALNNLSQVVDAATPAEPTPAVTPAATLPGT